MPEEPRYVEFLHRFGRFLVRTSRVIMTAATVNGLVAVVAWTRGSYNTFEVVALIAVIGSLTATAEQLGVEWIHQHLLRVSAGGGLRSRS